jgi:hypothetical protein
VDRGLEAVLDPDAADAIVVTRCQLEEEVRLGGEPVEDRAAREADLLLQARNRRALVAVPGEAPSRAREDALAALLLRLLRELRHRLNFTKQYVRFIIA